MQLMLQESLSVQSVTFVLISIQMNIRIYSYQENNTKKIDMNECPNKYLYRKYLNIRIFEYIRHTLPQSLKHYLINSNNVIGITRCCLKLIYSDGCYMMLIDADWCWLMLIDADWCCWCWPILTQRPMLIDADWCWLMIIDADLSWFICWLICWLILIDVDPYWLMLIDALIDAYWFWLMLK